MVILLEWFYPTPWTLFFFEESLQSSCSTTQTSFRNAESESKEANFDGFSKGSIRRGPTSNELQMFLKISPKLDLNG